MTLIHIAGDRVRPVLWPFHLSPEHNRCPREIVSDWHYKIPARSSVMDSAPGRVAGRASWRTRKKTITGALLALTLGPRLSASRWAQLTAVQTPVIGRNSEWSARFNGFMRSPTNLCPCVMAVKWRRTPIIHTKFGGSKDGNCKEERASRRGSKTETARQADRQ